MEPMKSPMRARLEFELPEAQFELRCAMNGLALQSNLREIDEHLRIAIKHHGDSSEQTIAELQAVRDLIDRSLLEVE